MMAGLKTRVNLAQRKKALEQAAEENLDELIKNTAEVSAL